MCSFPFIIPLYMRILQGSHSGTWYPESPQVLRQIIINWENECFSTKGAKAVISPHAGYMYSGKVATQAIRSLKDYNKDLTIFILGPCHFRGKGFLLSQYDAYESPFGQLYLDREFISKLYSTGLFSYISEANEDQEHSIEMQIPLIKHFLPDSKIVPIYVGQVRDDDIERIALELNQYFIQSNVKFVISSDFCHWGNRFQYMPMKKGILISDFIESLDKEGIDLICKNQYIEFCEYLQTTSNTICGQNPIKLLLKMILNTQSRIHLVDYQQSSKCKSSSDSSVSYAAICCYCSK